MSSDPALKMAPLPPSYYLDREILMAKTIATIAHYGQFTRSDNLSYINHPFAVAESVIDEYKPAAWLHDVLEDCHFISENHLYAAGISGPTILAVKILTREKSWETYDDYLQRIAFSKNVCALTVKLADLKHNLRPSCPDHLRKKYTAAVPYLQNVLTTLRPPVDKLE